MAVAFKMTEQVVQQICIKCCVKPEHSSVETVQMIQKASRDNAMTAVQIKLWHIGFNDGWKSTESNPLSGRHATSRTPDRIQAAINKDW